MKKFKGVKSVESIEKTAKENGWEVDLVDFNRGGDWIWIKDTSNRMLQIKFNTFNGQFFVYSPVSDSPVASHLSAGFDNKPWYAEILDLVYES